MEFEFFKQSINNKEINDFRVFIKGAESSINKRGACYHISPR